MTPERWRQIEELYHAAAGREPDDRSAFLARVCGSDAALRQQVEALLEENVLDEGFADGPAVLDPARLFSDRPIDTMSGHSVGCYDVLEMLGSGGMGEVYRAHDRRLGRDVAIKVLPGAFTSDPQRLARFEREARMLAAVNHPGICAIYGVEEFDGARYLILELVEGRTLAELLTERAPPGGMPLREAVRIARQIAEALEVAHEKGIVHRDLKPANIKVTPEGAVKVLDFGLARPIVAGGRGDLTEGLQVINGKRSEGPIIGTAAYMSPEQARGLAIDKRSDIWAFGCVLYEMLAGRQVFAGDTVSDTIARILEREPDWSFLPDSTPPAIRRLLVRCLAKDPKDRLRDIGDARIEIDATSEVLPGVPDATAAGSPRRWPAALAASAVVLSALAVLASWIVQQGSPSSLGDRFAKAKYTWVTEWEGIELDAAISADGKFAAFVADASGAFHVWRTQLGTGIFTNLTPGQDEERNRLNRPVGFSTDGTSIWLSGHPSGRRLRLMPFTGGPLRPFLEDHAINVAWSADDTRLVYLRADDDGDPLLVAERGGGNAREILAGKAGEHNHFPTWSTDGKWIYYVHFTDEPISADLWRVPAVGGVPERLTEQYRDVRYPTPLDGRTVLYVARDDDGSGPWLWAVDVDSRARTRVGVGPNRYLSVAASADAHRLIATFAKSTATLWSVPILDRVTDERDSRPYGSSPSRARAPRFGAGSLLYLSSTGSGDGLWRAQGTSVAEIWPSSDGVLNNPVAVASNGRMAVTIRTRGQARLTLVSPDGAVRRSIADGIDVRGTAAWSPGAEWVVTGGLDSRGPGLFKIPVEGGEPVRIATGPALDPVWSPGDDLIVYAGPLSKGTAPLLAVRPDSRAVSLPPIRTSAQGSGGVRFLPDGKAIVYLTGPTGSQQFWRLDLASHRIRQLARLPGNSLTNSFDITPDGRQIVFDRLRELSDIVMIDLPR